MVATNTRDLLDTYHFNVLKDMASLLGIGPHEQSKQAYMDALAPFLFTPQAVQLGLEQLGKREKEALAVIQRAGGQLSAGRLKQQLLRQRVTQLEEKQRHFYGSASINIHLAERYRTDFTLVLGRLLAAGLVCVEGIADNLYSTRTKIYYDNAQTVSIPPEIEFLLPDPPPLVEPDFGPESLNRIAESSARLFQRDVYLYWSTVRAEPLNVTNEQRLYKKDLKRVNAALQQPQKLGPKNEPDLPRLIFMRRLMESIGILTQKGKTITALEHPKFLSQGASTRVQRSFEQWCHGHFWNEILSIPNIRPYNIGTRLDAVPEQISQARSTVLDHIRALYQDDWTPIDALIDSLRLGNYDFLLPRDYEPKDAFYYSYASRTPYSSYGNAMYWDFNLAISDEAEGWEYIEAGFILSILLEPLYWMGLVDIGYINDQPAAYRVTAMGAWVLGVGEEIEIPEGEGRVVIQPNYEIYALDPINDMVLARLDEFADRISAERAIQYSLSRESVYRAQKKGWTADRIIDTLQKMSDQSLPQNVARTLKEWQALHERIIVRRQATILQAVDVTLMDEIANLPAVSSHLASRPGDAVVVIAPNPNATAELLETLQGVGHLPAQTSTIQDVLRPCLTLSEDGQIHFREGLPSIYLFGQIAPFTERDEQNRIFLTEAAVKAALNGTPQSPYSVEKILKMLHTLHIGPLPRWVEIKVRAWGHYYGDAAVQPLVLVQIRDPQTLKELAQDPDLQGILQPFAPTRQKALAIVSLQNLDRLYKALSERGMQISDQLE